MPYLKSAPSNLYICKFCEETKMPKFGTKNALFGYFLGWKFKLLLSYLKSAPSNLSNCKIFIIAKFSKITKMLKFGTKNPFFFGYFWARIYKNCFHIWNKHPQICQNEYLSHTANFGIGSAFSKFLRSAFSEGPGPRLGPLYNLCLTLVWQKGSNLK